MGKYYDIRDLIDKHPNAKMYWVISGRGNGKSL